MMMVHRTKPYHTARYTGLTVLPVHRSISLGQYALRRKLYLRKEHCRISTIKGTPTFLRGKNSFFRLFDFHFRRYLVICATRCIKIRTLVGRLVPEKPNFSKSMFRKKYMCLW